MGRIRLEEVTSTNLTLLRWRFTISLNNFIKLLLPQIISSNYHFLNLFWNILWSTQPVHELDKVKDLKGAKKLHQHLITAILTHGNGRVWCFPPGFAVFGLACCSHFWASLVCSQLPFLARPALPPITNHLSHDSHPKDCKANFQQESTKKSWLPKFFFVWIKDVW